MSNAVAAMVNAKLAEPTFTATEKQAQFITDVLSGNYLYMAMGGGIRGTKTWSTLAVLVILCRIYPRSRWAVVRKDLPTLRRNTVPSMNKLRERCEGFVGELNQSNWTYTCINGSEILLFPESFASDPLLERWLGLEVNGFLFEEANEMTEMAANKGIERAGSWIIPSSRFRPRPAQPPPYNFYTFNPCINWPRAWFYEPWKSGTLKPPFYFLPSTAKDNPYIPDAVREAWKNLPKADYDRFVEGEWNFTDDPDQLIKAEWIWNARNLDPIPGPPRMGVDVARFGDDQTVIARAFGNSLHDIRGFDKLPVNVTADYTMNLASEPDFTVGRGDIRIDTVGPGGGVADLCTANGYHITELIAGATPWERKDTFYKFKNVRSQMWWEAAEKLRLGIAPLPMELPVRLVADLTSVKYRIHADRTVEIEEKKLTKARLGRSPDWADAYLSAILDPPVKKPNQRIIPGTVSIRRY
jgi:hypothetical protein